jgi:DNA polymerase bacteriophage-type
MNTPAAHIDFETRSTTELKGAGVFRYAEDFNTYPWGFRWRIGNTGPVHEWRPGWPDPVELLWHIYNGGTVTAHNAAFERTIWNNVVVARICPHWPRIQIEQQDCTMARAAAIGHPQGLDALGTALETDMRKDREGHTLMMKMARPRRFNADGSITWWDDPQDIRRNMDYCGTDVVVETQADELVPPLSDAEREVWILDQHINERGVMVDMRAVTKIAQMVEYAKKQNDRLMRDITNREVAKCTNDAKIIAWLNSRGVDCTSLAKGEVDDVVFLAQNQGDEAAYKAIKLRQAAWKTSTAKYKAMDACVSSDHRIRGMLNYHGAATGRWAGRLVQPQNLPRVDPDDKELVNKIGFLHTLCADERNTPRDIYDGLAMVFGDLAPLDIAAKAIRSMFIAAPGKKLVGGDFSNIEGRVNSWLAGEKWKLQAFAEYDAGTGPDLYKLAYARSFNVSVESVGKGQKRQIGKVQELGLGFQGSIGAYITMGATYGVNPFDLSWPVYNATPAAQWDMTAAKYHQKGVNKYGLFEREWTALKVLVDNWRGANPAVVQSWWNYGDAVIAAVAAPGTAVHPEHTRLITYYCDGRALWCVLPGGRMLCYAAPRLVVEQEEYYNERGEVCTRTRRKVTVMGIDSRTHQWTRYSLYGGLLCENIVQATARDLMKDAMLRAEAVGFNLILTVHDELLCEVDAQSNYYTEHLLADIMAQKKPVYDGLPVSVGAWEDTRYVK